jgi:hypothetical protein
LPSTIPTCTNFYNLNSTYFSTIKNIIAHKTSSKSITKTRRCKKKSKTASRKNAENKKIEKKKNSKSSSKTPIQIQELTT